jgi:metal-responsive CopG/Arc/MetJ family transcriptional regulator
MALTVRLTPKTRRALDAVARRRGWTRSDVVREAIEAYAAETPAPKSGESAFDVWADVIGIANLRSDAAATRTTGERFTDMVRAKARTRRAR